MEDAMNFEDELIVKIKEKPELQLLDDSFVRKYLTDTPDMSTYPDFAHAFRSKRVKRYVREVRARLREVYGLFLERALVHQDKELSPEQLLDRHRSTRERRPYYPQLYKRLFSIIDVPENYRLLDIACGYNPVAYRWLPIRPREYVGCDLSSAEMALLQDFLSEELTSMLFGIDVLGEEFSQYVRDEVFDVVFLFKALDSFESVHRHSSKSLLDALRTTWMVVSFPLVSVGGAPIDPAKRSWFERFCDEQGWSRVSFDIPNERFYVVKK